MAPGAQPPPEIRVAEAGPEERAWLTREPLDPLLRDALDYSARRLDLDQVNAGLSRVALSRQRRILVARERGGGPPLALAVLETGDKGINPYHLLDCVRLFGSDEQSPRYPDACKALLLRARRHYAAHGPQNLVLFANDAVQGAAEEVGFHTIDQGMCWALHRDGFPAYLSHIYEIISPD